MFKSINPAHAVETTVWGGFFFANSEVARNCEYIINKSIDF